MSDAGRVPLWNKTGHHAHAAHTQACQVHGAVRSKRIDEVPAKARHVMAQQKLVSGKPLHSPIEGLPAGFDARELRQLKQLNVRHEPGMKHFFQQGNVALIAKLDVTDRICHQWVTSNPRRACHGTWPSRTRTTLPRSVRTQFPHGMSNNASCWPRHSLKEIRKLSSDFQPSAPT